MRKAIFCLFLVLSLSHISAAYAVDLYVSGSITPAAANGRYVPNGTYSGYNCWVHESGGYYFYNDVWATAFRQILESGHRF